MLKRFFIFLALVSIVCGAFYLSSPEKTVERKNPIWPVVNDNQVDRVDVCLLNQNCFSLVRRADGWNIAEHGWANGPIADTVKVKALLTELAEGKALRYLGKISNKSSAEYGFELPQVRIATGGGQELSMIIGGDDPSGEGVFALNSKEKGDLFLLSRDFVKQCEYPAEYYYNLFLVAGRPDKISSISLGRRGSFLWTLTRHDGESYFSFPAHLNGKPVCSSEYDFLMHSLFDTPAKGLVSSGSYELGDPVLNIKVVFDDKKVEEVEVFEAKGHDDFYLANSTIQNGNFIIAKEHLRQLDKKSFQMRQRNILSVETGKIGSLRVLQGNQTFVGMKSDKLWINSVDKKSLLGIDMSLWRLNELKFEAEPESNLSVTSEKVMELELMNTEGIKMNDVTFYSDPELPAGQCWLSFGNSSLYFPVSNKLLEDLQGQIPLRK
ncbi:DUF4340 domain-containing protein [Maridesulfovibrio zosterae]|uniref:DUF4340 domain-containing protein n=1 Tax=Maridesulfovibrio zosterae TaxID=82171 RepID=UPI0004275E86|nr:DUF4340 domain-containing protein [Maridesulfovibrio zosterae]